MTSVHQPFDIRIFHKECKSLAMAGYDVTLIAPHAGGDQTVGRIKLRAVAPPRERRERMTRTIPAIYRAAVKEDAAIYHFHDPELMPVAILLKLRGKKVIYDVHEDYASNMRKDWIPTVLQGPAALAVKVSEATLGRACNRIVAATPKIAGNFQPGRTSLVQNFPWLGEFSTANTPYQTREPIVAYVGYLADVRGLKEMTEAIKLVAAERPARLVLAGGMISGAQSNGFEARGGLIEQMGAVDRKQIGALLARSRVGIVVYHPTPNYYHGQPTKLLEYMAAGLPIVASDFPFYRQVIESSGCGVLVDPLKPKEIAEALSWLLNNEDRARQMGLNGQKAVVDRYNWEQEARSLVATYDQL
jgi:glycosyltransferase involved in cell wall biosynthesis